MVVKAKVSLAGKYIPVLESVENLKAGEDAVPPAATKRVALTLPTTCNLFTGLLVPIPIFPLPAKIRLFPPRVTVLKLVKVPSDL